MAPKRSTGPFITYSCICEKILQEKDGVTSLIRVVDRFVMTGKGKDAPKDMPEAAIAFNLALAFKAGEARGKHTITITSETPAGGEWFPKQDYPALFESEDRGVNLQIGVQAKVKLEGVYWIDVLLDRTQLLTRMPLRIMYQTKPA